MFWKQIPRKWLIPFAIVLIGAFVIGFLPKGDDTFELPREVDFNYHIRPILAQNCFICHGPDSSSRKANLRLDTREGATAMLEEGVAAIVPGSPHKSDLITRVSSDNPDIQMPPPEAKKVLTEREVALLRKWIKQGAKWKKHWAFIPPQMPAFPRKVKHESASDKIDFMVNKQLEAYHLSVSPQANPSSLVRRVSYLLTGLPPTPWELQSFRSDSSIQGYEQMVDHYLASQHYGERWARHWMDLVRYGEHMGHEFDYGIGGAWRYRDYLIRAFNEDVPYDQFVKEHLAGDLLPEPRFHPKTGTNESLLGTAYFFLGEGKHSPVSLKQEESDKIENMIDVTSKTFQGLTVGCAKCHDHKFDPIPATDYYAMYGMIESSRIGPVPVGLSREGEQTIQRLKEIKKEVRSQIGRQLKPFLQKDPVSIQIGEHQIHTGTSSESDATPYQILGDFRSGTWPGWHSNFAAFGDRPLLGEPVIDRTSFRLDQVQGGAASSRWLATGVQGALRSPNFLIQHDSIAIRASGHGGTIRIIVDNFQLIQDPLWGSFSKNIDGPEWKTYILDVSRAKGHKAYLEFLPGHYDQHVYHISPKDYIDIQYVVAYDSVRPVISTVSQKIEFTVPDQEKALEAWTRNEADLAQIQFIRKWVQRSKPKLDPDILSDLLSEYDSLATSLHTPEYVMGVTEGDPVYSPVFLRGSISQLTEERVPHQFLSAVSPPTDSFPQNGSGRLAWAVSVTDPANPLTSRIMANRIWHHLFGKGIVETVDNFGLQGKLPTHPELLDYLALQFMREGWSVKRLIKHLLMTEAFRRSTEGTAENQIIDPDNQYLHHFPVRRLEAEAIYDGILASSGCLDTTMYGEPVPIHLNEFMTGRGRPRISGTLDGSGRRNIYLAVRRNFLVPMNLTFDMPIPFSTFGKRNTTNVPAQSLTLMNDPFVHLHAKYFALNILDQGDTTIPERIQEIYRLSLSREATTQEVEVAKELLETLSEANGSTLEEMKDDPTLWAEYCHTMFNLKEFIHLM